MALDFYAGCLGGCAGVLVGHPFDTIKVRLQTQDQNRIVYKGTYDCLSTIIRNESVRGLFKGMSSPMACLSAINAIVFGTYGNLLRASTSPTSTRTQFVIGSTAGFVQSIVTSPMELAKTRMQLQGQLNGKGRPKLPLRRPMLYKNPFDCLRKIFRAEGTRGLFRGLWCTILRDSPGFGVYFSGYEYLTKLVTGPDGKVSTVVYLSAGGLAGVLSWTVTYPLDVIKSRIQADGMEGSRKYNGFCDCAIKSYKSEGIMAFTRGFNSTIIRAFPTNAATFTVFTWVFLLCDTPVPASAAADVKMATKELIMEKDIHGIAM